MLKCLWFSIYNFVTIKLLMSVEKSALTKMITRRRDHLPLLCVFGWGLVFCQSFPVRSSSCVASQVPCRTRVFLVLKEGFFFKTIESAKQLKSFNESKNSFKFKSLLLCLINDYHPYCVKWDVDHSRYARTSAVVSQLGCSSSRNGFFQSTGSSTSSEESVLLS